MDQNGSKTKITKDKNNKLEDSKQRGGGRAKLDYYYYYYYYYYYSLDCEVARSLPGL
jgi:hypothetical protein